MYLQVLQEGGKQRQTFILNEQGKHSERLSTKVWMGYADFKISKDYL